MRPELSPYLQGPYRPTEVETSAVLPVKGQIPADLVGAFVRNGPNPQFAPKGRYHWFDGDGMLHAVHFSNGEARYENRYVHTQAFLREREAGQPLWSGVMESMRDNPPDAPFKDTANTDVIAFNGELLALWYLSGAPIRLDPRTLSTLGPLQVGATKIKASAHAKVDPRTGELFFFDFGFRSPFMRYGNLSPDGQLHLVPVELPGPRLPHDLVFTQNHAILMDLPVIYDEAALAKQRWVTRFEPKLPARFAVIPRRGAQVRWFEAEPCYIYHAVNAWEDEDSITLIACRVDDPIPRPDPADGIWAQMLANLQVKARLCRWRFDLRSGLTTETVLDDWNTEFPMINTQYRGVPSRFSYHVQISPERTLSFDALVKYDTQTGARSKLPFGPGRYGSEAPFAPRPGATSEDDGYVLSFVYDQNTDTSELWIIDAQNFAEGPLARVALPQRVPLGFHGSFISPKEMGS